MKRIPTVKAVEAVFSRRRQLSTDNRQLLTELRTGPAARRALARDLVAALDQDMQYLGWFLAIVRAYPETNHNWANAMKVASAARFPLGVAEALLRADHTTDRPKAAGALQQAAA